MLRASAHRNHVLLVDDNPDELRLLIELLRGANFRIALAFDGTQGYKRAAAISPDLILMDLRMPHTDGFAACRLLQHDPVTAHIPIIFLSASRSLEERLSGLQNGGVDFILKPFAPAEVLARIQIHLKRAAQRRDTAIPATRPRLTAEQVIVNAATHYLSQCLASPPTLPELARKVGTYEKKLSLAFRRQLGKTVFEHLRDARLDRAQQLLTDTRLSITDIAAETGFSTAANFATAFRKKVGQTPSEFRATLSDPAGADDAEPCTSDASQPG
ncbi:DNA-binding response regulator [Bordetella genomosp. 1]|uniref:DNA-binding response regulator n=1 Tax=Bordetella genomosp. 1 TaxID=1395607 RepID=A0A261SGN0_9BORD|nr:DNA-binding response regulator [Bordetella genomosp. 1]OZI36147.1 DNA-binding response regulator [Bordetella genomosp. 1]OZI58843.1 DNA-binding response regulator [Bordetella genomosp. 1]